MLACILAGVFVRGIAYRNALGGGGKCCGPALHVNARNEVSSFKVMARLLCGNEKWKSKMSFLPH